ncbi:MAG: ABC transporter ATP-binding protein [Anaerolineae bacterium]|nr:ABC transporter ATP-binding protein [Anaerolineae bacterium]
MSIALEHVVKSYAEQSVVKDVSLEIESGELFVLLGASGSGKSTLLRLIAGLVPVNSGRIWLHGRDVTNLPPQQRNTGFVFQNYSLFQHMTVAENIEFALDIRRVARPQRRQRVAELLELIGMSDLGERKPSQISGGQQQRAALARALAHQPEVLLLDEPFGALDAKIRGQLRQNLREIQKRLGVTAILVTHDQEEAFELADRIGVIERGELLEIGTPDALYRRPQHPFTASFLGTANLLAAQRNSHQVHWGDVSLEAPAESEHLSNQPVLILSRPEEIELAASAEELHGQALGRGVVAEKVFSGAVEKVVVRLNENAGGYGNGNGRQQPLELQAQLNAAEVDAKSIDIGAEVWVGLKKYHLLPQLETPRVSGGKRA